MKTTEETILRESFKLFLAKGYDGTSVPDIERAAMITHGAIFHSRVTSTIVIILCCLGMSLQTTAAQEVVGRVVSKDRTPLENVHVLLYSSQDSTLLTMAVTDSLGRYAMKLPEKAFSVTYSLIGAKRVTIPYDSTLEAYREVIMEDDATALGEVVVLAHQVRTKPIAGGIECRILNQDLISNRTAVDLLAYVPMISKKGLDSYSVVGTDDVVFFINGRRSLMSMSALMSYLKTLSASQVKSMKVLYHPSPEYGVGERTAVIDLVIEDDNVGFQGSVRGELIRTRRWKETLGTTLVYQAPRWQVQLYAGARNLRDYERSEGETHYLQSGVVNTSEQLRDTRRRQYDLNLTGEYKIAEGHTVGASVDLYRYGGKPRTTITDRYSSSGIDSTFTGLINRDYVDSYIGSIIYYQGKLPHGMYLTAEGSGLWSDYRQTMSQRYDRSDLPSHPVYLDYQSSLPMATSGYSLKMQLSIPLSEKLSLYMGDNSSLSQARYGETYDIRVIPGSFRPVDRTLHYSEILHRPYLMANYQLPYNLTLYGGLYGQYHSTSGAYDDGARQHYSGRWYLLPYASVSWRRSALSLSYGFSMSNTYSSFASYSPIVKWSAMNAYTEGNPELRPARSMFHSLTARYRNFYAQAYYGERKDNIGSFAILTPDRVIASKSYNYGVGRSLSLSMGYGGDITSWWYVNTNVSGSYSRNEVTMEGLPQYGDNYRTWMVDGSFNNAFTLSRHYDWTADVNFSYSSPYHLLYTTQDGIMQCNIMTSKGIGSSVTLTLWAYKSWRQSLGHGIYSWGLSESHTPDFDRWTKSWGEDMGISLSISYYFGKSSLNQKIQAKRSDASRIISNND